MVKVKVLPISENWLVLRIGNLVYALNRKGYYIALDKEIWIPPFLKDAIRKIAKTAKQYGLIDYDIKIHTTIFQHLPYKRMQVGYQLFYHYGDEKGRQIFNRIMEMVKNSQ